MIQTLATIDMKADIQKKLKYINNPDSLSHGKHRGLNITETFLEKSDVGREYLGAHLAKGINYSTRRLIQAIRWHRHIPDRMQQIAMEND